MRRTRFSEQELSLEAERCVKYRGTARVKLQVLHFHERRKPDSKNVERLKNMFQTDKIRRLEPRNHIPVEVDQFELDAAIKASGVSAESLLTNPNGDPPLLIFPPRYQLTYLHGLHRIQAAREILPPTDAWWTVDLYLADAKPEFRTTLVEEYSNEEKTSDGEVYCKIRQYDRERNLCFKNRWKARLSDHGRRGLRQLDDHEEIAAAFDDLLDIPGLWDGMRISTLHKVIGMKCDEEVLHYLEHIKEFWSGLLRRDKAALQRVDRGTVNALELRAPKYSRRDAQVLQGLLLSGQIFSAFSQEERETIWGKLRSVDYLIPSLFTFFEDVKYLDSCADCLKRLVKLTRKDTVSSALEHRFLDVNQTSGQHILEVAESSFTTRPGRDADRPALGRLQLWIYAMRNYQEIPPNPKKKEKDLLAKAGCDEADETVLHGYATLADRVGFASQEIDDLKNRSSDRAIACNALLKARKHDRYEYDKAALEAHIDQIVMMFGTASPLTSERLRPALVSGNPQAPGNKCGFPDKDAYKQDKKYLFINNLHGKHDEYDEQGELITSFFVRRSVYFAFFGKSMDLEMDGGFSPSHTVESSVQQTGFSSHQAETDGIEQLERERRELERSGQDRLEQERLQRERREQEREEQEREEQEREEQERQERERLERETQALERQDLERQGRERRDRERQDRERQEQERIELQRLEEGVEREELQERLAEALQAQEKRDQEDKNQQKFEKREQEREEEERRRQETREQRRREEEETLADSERARKRHTQMDMESLLSRSTRRNESGRPATDQAQESQPAQVNDPNIGQKTATSNLQSSLEQVLVNPNSETARNAQTLDNGHASEQQRSTPPAQETPHFICITYKVWERGIWRTSHSLKIDPSDPSEIERMAVKYMRKGMRLFDTDLNILTPRDCFEAATATGNNTILLIPEAEINISKELETSISELVSESPSIIEAVYKRGRR